MSDNDYIAEYIKEKYPALLGFDFAMWKLGRQFSEAVIDMCKGIENTFNAIFDNKAKSGDNANDCTRKDERSIRDSI